LIVTETAELYGDAVFAHDHDLEAVRLDALARMFDPATRSRLSAIVRPGLRCIDIGAGLGRISGWLAEQAAPGEVIALDRDVRLLGDLPRVFPTVRVLAADITDPALELGTFDVVHSRLLLMHLRDRVEVFHKLASLVRPGGWIVLGEAVKATTMTGAPESPFRRLMDQHWGALENSIGTSSSWGLRYPELLREAGFVDIGVEMHQPAVTPTSAAGQFFQLNFGHLRERIIADGLVDEDTFDAAMKAMREPGFADLGMGLLTAWARKPM
jgi:SAM-dependent methyltransferase